MISTNYILYQVEEGTLAWPKHRHLRLSGQSKDGYEPETQEGDQPVTRANVVSLRMGRERTLSELRRALEPMWIATHGEATLEIVEAEQDYEREPVLAFVSNLWRSV